MAFGDWQTPELLARAITALLERGRMAPDHVLEPTCGRGSFLVAAHHAWPDAELHGYEVEPTYVKQARESLGSVATLREADFFATRWEDVLDGMKGRILVLGNPPWVTSSKLGALASKNLPEKSNFKNFSGLDAITGKANFDVSEWMLLRLLHALHERAFTLAMLVKSIVARRVLERIALEDWSMVGELRDIDARAAFHAAVDATLLIVRRGARESRPRWPRYASLDARQPRNVLGYVHGTMTNDIDMFEQTQHLADSAGPAWRSGLKHDCASVMEFSLESGRLRSRANGFVELERDFVFPLMKGSDVANGRWPPTRAVLVPQRRLGDDTARIARSAPRTWAYLNQHRATLAGRKSSIYTNQPDFSVFGIGDYTFAPWKVAIAGLYKRLAFLVVGPHQGRPVILDDTTYFLPFDTEDQARRTHAALCSGLARDFFHARIFWDDKRPINKRVLQSLDLEALYRHLGMNNASRPSSLSDITA